MGVKSVILLEGPRPSRQLEAGLKAKGIPLHLAPDVETCLAALQADGDSAVLIDLDFQRKGLDAIQEIKKISPQAVVLVLASREMLSVVDEALRKGAQDFLIKQPDLSHLEEIPHAIARNVESNRLSHQVRQSRLERRALAAAASESPEAIWIAEPTGKILFVNPVLIHSLGYDSEELIGRPVHTLFSSPASEDVSWSEISEPFPHRRWQGKTTLKRREGSEMPVSARIIEILDEAGKPWSWVGMCREEEHPPEVKSQSENRGVEVFYDIVDDLKSPLAAMIGYLEVASTVASERVEPNLHLSIKRVEALAKRLLELVTNYMETLEIEGGRFGIQKSPFDINQLLELAVEQRKSEAEAKDVEIVLQKAPDLPLVALDSVQFERAVGILISNAIALSPLGGTVTVSSRRDPNQVAIAIKDTGAGLAEDEIPLLFDRTKKLRRRGTDVSTVGLYVARHIVSAHEGRIDVQSESLEGTTLTIALPL